MHIPSPVRLHTFEHEYYTQSKSIPKNDFFARTGGIKQENQAPCPRWLEGHAKLWKLLLRFQERVYPDFWLKRKLAFMSVLFGYCNLLHVKALGQIVGLLSMACKACAHSEVLEEVPKTRRIL